MYTFEGTIKIGRQYAQLIRTSKLGAMEPTSQKFSFFLWAVLFERLFACADPQEGHVGFSAPRPLTFYQGEPILPDVRKHHTCRHRLFWP